MSLVFAWKHFLQVRHNKTNAYSLSNYCSATP